ncbi:YncE family protein [Bacillus cereus]|uniref:40-residue YVTN family beta-propeller n=1 Tax=Bacillus cereus TIAC219 TaxID=718222 RepID=A0ABC9SV55_BACCE|nr:YncE family protein [Bacillus cereus]EJP85811.1 40-residue YVTN family beta-propeller [Bacillus cereus VD022]EOQ59793.1 40-residue YVTN family beta-propeller [Bacillus cereus TIAC219]TKH60867.1 YncE family protein [Bacillus cereus]
MDNKLKINFINRLLKSKKSTDKSEQSKEINLTPSIQEIPEQLTNKIVTEGSVYVAGFGGVSVIDVKTNVLKAKIITGGSTSDIAITSDETRIYVAPFEYFDVSVIDTKSNTVIDAINLTGDSLFGTSSFGIAITPDGESAYLTNDNTILRINTSTNMITKTVNINEDASGIAITSNGKFAYIAGAKNVFVLDTESNTIVKTIDIYPSATLARIVITPDEKLAYITNFDSNELLVIDLTANILLTKIELVNSTTDIAITPDGKFAYCVGGNNLWIIEVSTNMVVNTLEFGENLWTIAITSDGRLAYIGDYSNSVYIVDTLSNTLLGKIDVEVEPFRLIII